MKTDNNRKQLLKGVLAGSVSLGELQQAVSSGSAKPVFGLWDEISLNLFRHQVTGEERPAEYFQKEQRGSVTGYNILVKKFWENGRPVPDLAYSESTLVIDEDDARL